MLSIRIDIVTKKGAKQLNTEVKEVKRKRDRENLLQSESTRKHCRKTCKVMHDSNAKGFALMS